MEPDAKPVVEHQRRLIPKMKEVVRNEVLKLLDAGIIYPIADSRWVSLVHCVPKKGGITVVPNENNEFIPQRVVVGYRMCIYFRKDFYFRALGSLVVLSFPQPLSFSSVFPKPLSETLKRSSDGRIPI
jgi:hypothetical protein